MALDIITLALAKKYTADSLEGAGALKGQDGVDGVSPTIVESADNTDDVYKLDITDANGTFTTPNLKGADETGSSTGDENVIESVKVNGTVLIPDEYKAVDIDLTGYVEAQDGYGLISDSDLTQISANKSDIANLSGTVDGKVDKADGYSLVSDSDIAQITTNKDDIATLNGTGDGSIDKKIATALSELTYLSKQVIDEDTAAIYTADPTQAEFNVIYLVKDISASGADVYFEYQRLGDDTSSTFEITGDTSTDLSNYYTKGEIATELDNYYTKAETVTALADKVDAETGKGLSANDFTDDYKAKLDGIESGAQANTVAGVKGNAESSYRTGNINITPTNIGLGNVDNTADADKEVASADKLTTARTVQTDLASTAEASFDGSEDVTVGVMGVLPITNGGTGNTTGRVTNIALIDDTDSTTYKLGIADGLLYYVEEE